MGIRTHRPTSPSRRSMTVSDFSEITKHKPEESLLRNLKKTAGRNSHGHITTWHRGGGNRRHYRVIDFKRQKDNIPARVAAIEYDPNRSANIALLHYADGEKRYILAPNGLNVDDRILSGQKVEPKVGNCMPLSAIPVGLAVHNVELRPGQGGKLVRSAGVGAQLMAREDQYALIVMPSGEHRRVLAECRATIGVVGNGQHNLISLGKAGRNRHHGWRPTVRGVAMNPVAHPLGGGEGRSSGGRHPCSPWGKLERKTRNPRKTTSKFIVRRRKK